MIAIALVVVGVAVAIYLAFFRGPAAPVDRAETPAASQPAAEPAKPLGGEPDQVDVPPLDQSDDVVRALVRKLSSHPRVAAWLATDGLIRNFTAVVVNVADGTSPAPLLPRLRPSGPYTVSEQAGGRVVVDPNSYRRYDQLADAVASIDAGGAATLYATLKPRIEEAYRDLGYPEGSFDRALERAIVSLVTTPVPSGSPQLVPRGIGYGYADERFESLSPPQKQLLRMGPDNARAVQDKLREIAAALGIPPDRLR
jgi:hypothetical protein